MTFVIEKTTEDFTMKKAKNYEILYDEYLDKYGLILDDVLFTFVTEDQANLLERTWKDKEKFESFFSSVGIGDKYLNLQPEAARHTGYVRPSGYLE